MSLLACCCGCKALYTVPLFTNDTQVANYTTGPATIDPYSRPWYYTSGGGCVLEDCGVPDSPVCGTNGYDGSGDLHAGITSGGATVKYYNGYSDAGTTTTIENPCYGWKGVMAIAPWPGRWGFVNSGPNCCGTGGGQDQTKYTSITAVIEADYESTKVEVLDCTGATRTFHDKITIRMSQTASVDGFGNVTRTGSVSIYVLQEGTDLVTSEVDSCDIADNAGVLAGEGNSGNAVASPSSMIIPRMDMPLDAACGIISVGGTIGGLVPGARDVPFHQGTVSELNALDLFPIGAGSAESGDPCTPETYVPEVIVVSSTPATFECSDARLSAEWAVSFTGRVRACCEDTYYSTQNTSLSYRKVITLGGESPYSAVKQKCKDLLGEWSLVDDQQYPWRTDSMTWLVPLVTMDARSVAPELNWGTNEDCEFTNEGSYTGEIRGIPNPVGYERHFNFDHVNHQAVANGDGSVCTLCSIELGKRSAAPIPATATQWTNQDTPQGPNTHGPCAWISNRMTGMYGATGSWPDMIDEGVRMHKWAETVESWPALNYSRPCARDRYLFDEEAIACIVDFTSPDLEIEAVPLSGPTEFEVGDVVAINNEVYQIATKTDAQNYTVGSKLYDLLIDCDGASKLRFPTVRGICGELDVSSATQTSPGVVTIVVAEKHWLKRNGTSSDTVNFSGVSGLGSGLTATVIGDTSFTVPGTLSGSYTSGGKVSQTGSNPTWDTTCPRGSFFTREWSSNYRGYAEAGGDPEVLPYSVTETARSFTYDATRPYVVVISPNTADTPTRGVRYDFGTVAHDQCYGEEWAMDVVQALTDPYWQRPHVPCAGGSWVMDSAPCAGDGDYPYPPMVEARLAPPSGAPTETVALYAAGTYGLPGAVSHPNCDANPYAVGSVHTVRAAWETCETWPELTMHRCVSFPWPA